MRQADSCRALASKFIITNQFKEPAPLSMGGNFRSMPTTICSKYALQQTASLFDPLIGKREQQEPSGLRMC
jgi:hypothetical protein